MSILAAATATPSSWVAPMVTVLGVLALGFILMLSLRDRMSRRAAPRTARQQIDEVKSRLQPTRERQVGAGATEMHDTAQRLAAQLDNKAERLEQLIAAADRRIAQLGAAPSAAAPAGGRRSVPPPAPHGAATSDDRGSIYALADEGLDPVAIAQQLDEQVGKIELILALRADQPTDG